MKKRKFKVKKSIYRLWLGLLIFPLILMTPRIIEAMATKPKKPRYNLLLITVDTLRPDHLGCYGYQDATTPSIDALASEGILFTQALTPVPITLPAHVSIMTGLYPIQHGIYNNANFVLGEEAVTLAEIMKSNGYITGACIGACVLNSMFGLNQGFDTYDNSPQKRKRSGASPFDNERRAEEVTKSALQWLEKNHVSPFFLWVHYFDPHAIYLPPSPFKEKYKEHLYDGEIAYIDKCLGDLFDGLKKVGVSDKTVIILTSDHGEGLGEHGEPTHAVFIYDSTLHVPLIIKPPFGLIPLQDNAQSKIASMVTILDIFPTIMDLFSIRADKVSFSHLPGKSLVSLIAGKCQTLHQEIYCETLYPELNFGWSRIEGIRTRNWKYIKAPRPELYNLSEDSYEKCNLLSDQVKVVKGLGKKLVELKKKLQKRKIQPQLISDSNVLQRLESLGYFRSAKKDTSAGDLEHIRPDPKDMIQLIERIDRGLSYYYLESYDLAYTEFNKILEVNPENISATFYLACVEEKMGKLEQARDRFLHLLSMQPNYLEAHIHLGIVYHELGKLEEAAEAFKLALQEAKYPDVYYNLSAVYKEMGIIDEADSLVKSAIELDPNYGDALNLLGEIALAMGRVEEARKNFYQVLNIEPDHLEAHNNLGVIYYRESRLEEALKEFFKAASIDPNNAEVHNNIGSLYLTQGAYSVARDAFKKALGLKPNYAEAWVNLGSVYFKEGELEKAKELYLQVTELFPKNQEAWNYLGLTYFTQGEYKAAVDSFEKALKTGPARVDIYLSLSKTYSKLLFFNESLSCLNKVVEIESHNREAHSLMGHILYDKLGRAEEAVKEWEEAYSLDPNDPIPLMNLAAIKFQTQKFREAITFWEKVLEIDPNSDEPYLHIGTAYLKQHNIEEAIQAWQIILKRKPLHPEALINLGTAFYQKGDLEGAIEVWQKAEQLSRENPKIHYNLALAFFYLRNYKESMEELKEVLRLEPDHTQARMLIEIAKQQESY